MTDAFVTFLPANHTAVSAKIQKILITGYENLSLTRERERERGKHTVEVEGREVQNTQETHNHQKNRAQISLPVRKQSRPSEKAALGDHQGRVGMKSAGHLKQQNMPGQAQHK